MADRYWRGGTGTWNTSSTTNWSTTSGGSGGASVPTAADSVFFDQAGTYTVTMTGTLRCLDITVSAGTVTFPGSGVLTISGSMSLVAGTIWSNANVITFNSTTTGKTITSNGTSIAGDIDFNGVGGGWTLQTALTGGQISLTNGALALNDKTLTGTNFSCVGTGVCSMDFGTIGTFATKNAAYSWDSSNVNLTVSGTPLASFNYSGASSPPISVGVRTESQTISFNFTAGTYFFGFTTGAGGDAAVKSINFTGFSGLLTTGANLLIYGNLTLSTTMTTQLSGSALIFSSTSGTKTISGNGTSIQENVKFNGVGGTWQLLSAMTILSGRVLTHINGTIDLNGKTLTTGGVYTNSAGTKNITFNGGTIICPNGVTNAFENANPTGFTTTAGTGVGKISMTAATAKTFTGGGSTFNCTLSNDGAGALTVAGSSTFTTIANGVQPTAFTFTAATTQTVTNWNVSGTAGNLVTIISRTAGVPALLSKASGTVSSDYLSLKDSTATGGAVWYAGANSTNVSGNLGWIFSSAPSAAKGNFFFMF